jgi:hypothetical protein
VLIRGKSWSSLVYLFRGSVYFSPEVFQEEFLSSAMCVGAFTRAMPATKKWPYFYAIVMQSKRFINSLKI